jgi:class 3 adenylate cyclase
VIGLIEPHSCMDVWGDTVLQAADLQRKVGMGGILVSGRVYDKLRDNYNFTEFPGTSNRSPEAFTDELSGMENSGDTMAMHVERYYLLEGYKSHA